MPRGDQCNVTDCDRVLTGRGEGHGMCSKHYNRWVHHGHTDTIRVRATCTIDGCDKAAVGRGWCSLHCGLCTEPVDRRVRYPDLMSPSIDHVIPLSRGGKHERSNAQTAHWICNVRKGSRYDEVAA